MLIPRPMKEVGSLNINSPSVTRNSRGGLAWGKIPPQGNKERERKSFSFPFRTLATLPASTSAANRISRPEWVISSSSSSGRYYSQFVMMGFSPQAIKRELRRRSNLRIRASLNWC